MTVNGASLSTSPRHGPVPAWLKSAARPRRTSRSTHGRDRAGTTQSLCTNSWTNPSVPMPFVTLDPAVAAPKATDDR